MFGLKVVLFSYFYECVSKLPSGRILKNVHVYYYILYLNELSLRLLMYN
jgi:hypothetical protein